MLSLLLLAVQRQPLTMDFTVDGVTRSATFYQPLTRQAHPPVVFCFHGHMGNARQAARSFKIQDAWPEAVVVYMQGLPTKSHYDPQGRFNGWETAVRPGNKDVLFFDRIYQSVMTTYNCDPKQVFAMGHSNGAMFMYTLWSMRGDKFAGFGSAEGTGGQNVALTPKPFFITIGSHDPLVPPAIQHASLDAVLKVNGGSKSGSAYGEKGTLYLGSQPTVLWAYDGGHAFPEDSVATMVRFFQEVGKK